MRLLKKVLSICLSLLLVSSFLLATATDALALSENARYYISLPEVAYATTGVPFKIYYKNILSLPNLKITFTVPEELKRTCYNDRIEITAAIPGDFSISWRVYDSEYVMVDSGELLFIARDLNLTSATALVIGDSTINEGIITRELLEAYEKNGSTLTLLGGIGTKPNLHEGRGGWTSAMYCNVEKNGIYKNAFYNEGFDFSYYMASMGYCDLDYVIIQLGINDIKKMTLENYSSKKVISYFEKMITSINEYDEALPIIIGITIPSSEKITDFNDSSVVPEEFEYRNNIIHFASDLINYFQYAENVFLCPINCVINSATEFENALHPTDEGYGSIATEYISTINAIYNNEIFIKAPKITQIKSRNGYIQLEWDATYGAQSYRIYRNNKLLDEVTSLSYKDVNIKSGGSYSYKIVAVCENGDEFTSDLKKTSYLSTPVLKSASNAVKGVSVKWGAVESAEGYYVYRKTTNGSWARIGETTATSFTDTKAKSGVKYYYTVIAKSGDIQSSYNSAGVSVYFLATPSLTSAENKSNGVVVKWSKVSGAKGYRVYRKTSKNGSWSLLTKTTSNSYTDKNVKSNGNYYYTVRAYNGNYLSSFVSSGIATKFLSTPKLTKIKTSKSGVTVTYSKITGATSYVIYRKTAKSGWSRIATVNGNSKTSYLDKTAKKDVTYTYTVRAKNSKYMSSYVAKGVSIKDKY